MHYRTTTLPQPGTLAYRAHARTHHRINVYKFSSRSVVTAIGNGSGGYHTGEQASTERRLRGKKKEDETSEHKVRHKVCPPTPHHAEFLPDAVHALPKGRSLCCARLRLQQESKKNYVKE
jgi:hypothetical protein